MSKRREFTRAVKAEIVRRATHQENGRPVIRCERCHLATTRFDIDHTIPDALFLDKSRPLTAADGELLCSGSRESCHGKKTAEQDQPAIAKAKRVEAKRHAGIRDRGPLAGADAEQRAARQAARSADRRGDRMGVPKPRALFV